MILSRWNTLSCALAVTLFSSSSAFAHVGNNDVYQTVAAGPYKLFVDVRVPLVIPGQAVVEVRSIGAPIRGMTVTPLPLTGDASSHAPVPDVMKASVSDPAFFTGSLWIMVSGSWKVRFDLNGAAGASTASVPVPAVPTTALRMQRSLGLVLALLGCALVLGLVWITAAAVREAQLVPGSVPGPTQRRKALVAGAAAFAVCAVALWLGGKWWNVDATVYASSIHRNSELRPTLDGNRLNLSIGNPDPKAVDKWRVLDNTDLLPDHGHLIHLYAIRWPQMDAAFHLHPVPNGDHGFTETLPVMPPGKYHLYADVVFRNGFPETETALLTVPAGMTGGPLGSDDASAMPQPVASGQLGPTYQLPDGYRMVWEEPSDLAANTPYILVFRLLDPQGKPAADMQPYLGMAGHAAFVKTDGSAFAHTHPDGSAAMPAVMLANESSGLAMNTDEMNGMTDTSSMNMNMDPVTPTVSFPYGFPSAGAYRVFIQMKHGTTVETGVFDANVQ